MSKNRLSTKISTFIGLIFVLPFCFTDAGTAYSQGIQNEKMKLAEFRIDTVGDGVYVAVPVKVNHGFVEPNITIVEGDKSLLVIDAGFLPSSARQIISKLKIITSKPVRYLLNTHWHGDHPHANSAWKETWPGLEIIAHTEGKREIIERGLPDVEGFITKYYPARITQLKREIDEEDIPPAEKSEKERRLKYLEQTLAELKTLEPIVPERTYKYSLILDLGNRLVHLLYLGLGNTYGDAIAYIPDERILVTGDLVVHPRPYVTSDHYRAWAETLERMSEIPADHIILGHGVVQDDFEYINSLIALFRTVVEMVTSGYKNDVDLEELQNRITIGVVEKKLEDRYGIESGYFGMSDAWIEYFVSRAYEQIESE